MAGILNIYKPFIKNDGKGYSYLHWMRKTRFNGNADDIFFTFNEMVNIYELIKQKTFQRGKYHLYPLSIKGNYRKYINNQMPIPRKKNNDELSKVLIFIPVYNGSKYLDLCLKSLSIIESKNIRIIITDDASTDLDIKKIIENFKQRNKDKDIKIFKNETNLGFTRNVNRTFDELQKNEHLLILNSDTIIPKNLITNLLEAFKIDKRLGIVSPISNNNNMMRVLASPFMGNNIDQSVEHQEVESINTWLSKKRIENIYTPTVDGFCMLINHKLVKKIGRFNENVFPRGYGEENDYCLRAWGKGFTAALVASTFVYHWGTKSFSEEEKVKNAKAGMQRLNEMYPFYQIFVNEFIQNKIFSDKMNKLYLDYLLENFSVVLHLVPSVGGGAKIMSQMLSINPKDKQLFISIQSLKNTAKVKISDQIKTKNLEMEMDFDEFLSKLVKSRTKIVIHYVGEIDVRQTLKLKNSSYSIEAILHDFNVICPRNHLQGTESKFCGIPTDGECQKCVSKLVPKVSVSEHKEQKIQILDLMDDQISTISPFLAETLSGKIGKRIKVIEHISNNEISNLKRIARPTRKATTQIKFGWLGVPSEEKGLQTVVEILEQNFGPETPTVECHHFGPNLSVENLLYRNKKIIKYGEYEIFSEIGSNKFINSLVNSKIDFWLFPTKVPETYSLTLDIALKTEIPIVSFNVGEIPKRLAKSQSQFLILEIEDSTSTIFNKIVKFMSQNN